MYPASFRAGGAEQASLQPTITNTNTNFACFHGHGAPETSSFLHTLLPTMSLRLEKEGQLSYTHLPMDFVTRGKKKMRRKKKKVFLFFSFFSLLSCLLRSCYLPQVVTGGRQDAIQVQGNSTGSPVAQPAATRITLLSPGQHGQNGATFSDKH